MTVRPGLMAAALAAVGVCAAVASREAPAGPPVALAAPPQVVTLEGAPEARETRVTLRTLGASTQPVELGVVPHVEGSARRGTLAAPASGRTAPRVYVVVAERAARHASTYESALWRVDGVGVAPVRLVEGVTDASRALVTERGDVLVQRGRAGDEGAPPPGQTLRERVDELRIDRVDPDNGATVTVWTGRGMLAFLATALAGDEVLVEHVREGGASLFALDARSGRVRVIVEQMDALARDFSYDKRRDELSFVRAASLGSDTYEVVTLRAHGDAAPRVRWRGASDHLMPRALHDGTIALSLPGDRGLALLGVGAHEPARVAPLGDGADEVFAESPDARWIAFRHRTLSREMFGLYAPGEHRAITLDRPEVYVEFVGFVPRGAP